MYIQYRNVLISVLLVISCQVGSLTYAPTGSFSCRHHVQFLSLRFSVSQRKLIANLDLDTSGVEFSH